MFEDVIQQPKESDAPGRTGRFLTPKIEECADWNTLLSERMSGKSPVKAKPTMQVPPTAPAQTVTTPMSAKARKPSIMNGLQANTPTTPRGGEDGKPTGPTTPSGSNQTQ